MPSLFRCPNKFFALALFAFVLAGCAQPGGVQSKTATIYGMKIHYLEAGTGPTVILLHGLGADASVWAPTIAPLARHYRVIVPDQIGFGRSDKPLINYRIATLVDFLDGFYQALGIERATLVGNSLGGAAAASFALAHPQKVERLVLVASGGYALPKDADPNALYALNPSTRAGMKQVLQAVFYDKERFVSDAGAADIFAKKLAGGDGYAVQKFLESYIRGEDLLDGRLAAIGAPTLVVWGREDALTPLPLGERFKKDIPRAELVVFDKCGHLPQIEQAEQFNAAVLKFLAARAP